MGYYMKPYCVYLTRYLGDAFPKKFSNIDIFPTLYYGCCFTHKIFTENYIGSVKSNEFKLIWDAEKKNNPHLFTVTILREFDTRAEALQYEHDLQQEHDVVNNPRYFNKLKMLNANFGGPRCGKENSKAKHFLAISPDGEPHDVHGELAKFCRRHNLSKTTMRNFVDKGIIAVGPYQSRFTSDTSRNCQGWQICTV